MPLPFEIEHRFASLEKVIATATDRKLDEQLASYLCKLGSVLICGNIERCVEHIVVRRISQRAINQVTEFFKSYFKRGTNYDCDQICKLLFRFDTSWGRRLQETLESKSYIRESVSSCYAVRNSIAHGGAQSLGAQVLRQYFDASFDLIAEVDFALR